MMKDVLLGHFKHNLDPKNRVAIPAKLREDLGDSFVLCVAPNGDKCLFAYSMRSWEKVMEYMRSQEPSKQHTRRQRRLYMYAEVVETDKQGRITIPAEFVKKADLVHEVLITGMGERVELWSPERWDEMMQAEYGQDEESGLLEPPI